MWADPRFKKAAAVRRCIAHGARMVGVSPDSPERRKRDVSKRIGTAFRLGAAAQRLRIDPGDYQKPAAVLMQGTISTSQHIGLPPGSPICCEWNREAPVSEFMLARAQII